MDVRYVFMAIIGLFFKLIIQGNKTVLLKHWHESLHTVMDLVAYCQLH
jgi:hypothetical protein